MLSNGKKVSLIIPAYNEGKRIDRVLRIVTKYKRIDEIFVIDNASVDDTVKRASRYKNIKVVTNEKNIGKAGSVIKGAKLANGDLIMLLDADISGLTSNNLDDLLEPHENEECMTLSLRGNSVGLAKITKVAILTGERVLPKKYLQLIADKTKTGYAIENHINQIALECNLPIISVDCSNILNVFHTEKRGFYAGIMSELNMLKELFTAFPIHYWFMQQVSIPIVCRRYRRRLK